MDPLERLVNLAALLLNERRPLTFDEIRSRMSRIGGYEQTDKTSAKRQFERDKDALRAIGIPIEAVPTDPFQVEQGYVVERERYALPEIEFTPEEVAALFVAARAPGQDGDAAQAFLKLVHETDAAFLTELSDETGTTGIDVGGPHLRDVAEAVAGRRRIRFRYKPVRGRPGQREVDAWGLVFRRGNWYLVGQDRKRKEPRSFRLSRFLSGVKDVGEGEVPPKGFAAKDHLVAGPWGLGEPETTARIAFSPKVGWWALGPTGAQVVRTRRDGWVVAEVPAATGDAFVAWILSFGPDAKVLSPKSIRSEVVRRLEATRAPP